MLAPENTAEAAGLAIQSGAFGLESDVRVSLDGQLFLMHDTTLARTTNVESVFLQRTQERAESFTRAELDRLHAGAWFVTADPFGTIQNGDISQDQRDRYERVRLPIPAFADWLEDVRQASVIFIFDLQPAPSEHPFAGELLRFALEEIQAAGVDDKIWLLVDPTQAALLAKSHPAIWRAAGIGAGSPPPAHELVAQGYELVNAGFDLPLDAISNYRKAGLWVNLWTIDEPWLYSFFWLNGLDSVTTNNVHTLSRLALPMLAIPTPVYLAVWAFLGLIGCIAALWRKP
jgi:glycerophosphoryl diester phosphodiesterase